jgi:hypothetical protein
MGLISDVVLFPITGPYKGFRGILGHIQAQVEAEMMDDGKVQASLLELDIRHEAGQIPDEEYETKKNALVEKLNQIRTYKQQSMQTPTDVSRSGQ